MSDQQEDDSLAQWEEFFERNKKEGKEYFLVQNFYSKDNFHFSDSNTKCTAKDAMQYVSLLDKEDFSSGVTFSNNKYTFIKKFEYSSKENLPLYFFLSKEEVVGDDKERVSLIVKFITDEVIFIGKCLNSKKTTAINFVGKNYNYY
ncbi:hypothetical protein VCUG_00322 [Vavraia culicis subsp. floridensis]|uniref:Profilin n=1 Tax=Vavraia culicis (isolate floridensis) TaxID=948595 RepID=L2GX71_VAVCU|nr:uncharacterized protein VCUG_00322 [Vavraia culicis subsp. floridensis]ELA48281.1 hypothetical protein VCUG_00322 [Vavraia culicis subsp. floridensis]